MASSLVSSLLTSAATLLQLLRRPPAAYCPPRVQNLQRLERLLRRIQATLDDAGEREVKDSSTKLWIEELTELALDAEDVLDYCRYKLLRDQVQERQGAIASESRKRKHALEEDDEEQGDISQRIEDITRLFEEISKDRAALHLGPDDGLRTIGRQSPWESRTSSHLLDESLVFGRDKEVNDIIKLVLSFGENSRIQVLPIVGMGGIGKTTVAQMIYNDCRVQESFGLSGWIHVSQTFDLRRLTIGVTESFTRKPCDFDQLSSAHDILKKAVYGESVFLVLDDLWNEQQNCWQDCLCPLKSAHRVIILVTTRSKEVSKIVQTVEPLVLGSLSEDHCWLLFKHYAFGDRIIDEKSNLFKVGRKIMQKCSGLPLAVKSIGCLLRSKVDMQTWMEISESEFWEYSCDNEEIFCALRLSFYRLPARLKPCFLLCALYPKGETFTKDDMIHLWIAHGYIQPTATGCKTLEKVASEYFDELNARSLIETDSVCLDIHVDRHRLGRRFPDFGFFHEVIEHSQPSYFGVDFDNEVFEHSQPTSSIGKIFNTSQNPYELSIRSLIATFSDRKTKSSLFQRFRLHDMIWDLAKSLSSSLLSVVAVKEGSLYVENKVQHLFFGLGRSRSRKSNQRDHREARLISNDWFVRNQTSAQSSQRIESLDSLEDHMNLAKHQTYLAANARGSFVILQNRVFQLHKMTCLRTLVLKQWTFNHISMCGIKYLRALVLDSCKDSGCISAIQYLRHLRYLRVTNCDSMIGENLKHLTDSICHLYSLEKLIVFTCWKEFSMKSCNLVSLRYLHLSIRFSDWSLHPFCHFSNLDTLCLESCDSISELPLCIGNLMNLRRLKLVHISQIKKLNNFSFRYQNNNNKCDLTDVILPVLEELELDSLSNLQGLYQLQDSDCPKLQSITIRNCHKLRRIPYFGSVRNLIIEKLGLTDLQLSAYNVQSQLQILDIRYCLNLKYLIGLKNLCCLGSLYIAYCPELIAFCEDKLPFRPQHVCIDECPGLKEWCDEQELYYQVPRMVKISDIKRAKEKKVAYFPSFEYVALDTCPEKGSELILSPDSWLPSQLRLLKFGTCSPSHRGGLSMIGMLEIRGCPKLAAVMDLEKLNFLHSLVIADCPMLYLLPEMNFPPLLTSLTVEGCHKLLSLNLNLSDPLMLIELEVSDCQGLVHIGHLGRLSSLQSLVLLHCTLLHLQELLPSVPESVIVFLCPKSKKWCEVQSIQYQEDLLDS